MAVPSAGAAARLSRGGDERNHPAAAGKPAAVKFVGPAQRNLSPDTTASALTRVSAGPKRTLILHYHLFKNAGTSIDELLRWNFCTRWVTQEFHVKRSENAAAVAGFICSGPDFRAISSHTALLPIPQISGVEIFPIILIRHPVDRLRSAYEFERKQDSNTAGAQLAKTHDLGGYLRELLRNQRHRQIRNFQTFRLSHSEPSRKGSELQRAIVTLQKLQFVGLVERFDESVRELQIHLLPMFPNFHLQPVHRNAAASRQGSLLERLANVKATLGDELYEEICAANADDLAIHDMVNARFQAPKNAARQ